MDFLKQLTYDKSAFTEPLLDFENVKQVDDDDAAPDHDSEDDDSVAMPESCLPSQLTSLDSGIAVTSQISSSSASSTSSFDDTKLMCGICLDRQKDTLLDCGHTICGACFIDLKTARKKYCEEKFTNPRQRRAQTKLLECPFATCRKAIGLEARTILFD